MKKKPVRLGVITNPSAQHNVRFPYTHGRLGNVLGRNGDAIVTANESKTDEAVRHLIVDQGTNVLGINGGDGTIHSALNALISLLERNPDLEKPTLLLLNGGTYNIASRAMRTNHHPVGTLKRFVKKWCAADVDSISIRSVGLLEIKQTRPKKTKAARGMTGMVFGSQIIANTLELCDQTGGGYTGFSKFLAKGVGGYFLKTDFFKKNKWRLAHTADPISVDNTTGHGSIGVVASTVDVKLVRGLVWALSATDPEDGFHSKTIAAKNPADVVRLIPYLLWEIPHPMITARPRTKCIKTSGNFTLDGELYPDMGPVEITPSPWRFDVVAGEDM